MQNFIPILQSNVIIYKYSGFKVRYLNSKACFITINIENFNILNSGAIVIDCYCYSLPLETWQFPHSNAYVSREKHTRSNHACPSSIRNRSKKGLLQQLQIGGSHLPDIPAKWRVYLHRNIWPMRESLRNCDVRQVLCILTIFCRFQSKNVCIFPKFSSFQLFQSEIVLLKCCKEIIVPLELLFFRIFRV